MSLWALRVSKVICVVAMPSLLAGCAAFYSPEKSIRDSPAYIEHGTLAKLVKERQTQDGVIASLGQPDSRNEKYRALAFVRCVSSEGREWDLFVVVPLPNPKSPFTDCEFAAVWFDETGRAIRQQASRTTFDDRLPEERTYVTRWIEAFRGASSAKGLEDLTACLKSPVWRLCGDNRPTADSIDWRTD